MDNKKYAILEELGIDLDISSEVELLEKVNELNKENHEHNLKSAERTKLNKEEIEKLLQDCKDDYPDIDLDRLNDREYLVQKIKEFGYEFETLKAETENELNKNLAILQGGN